MTTSIVRLPFPPSVNNLFAQARVNGKTRRFQSKRYKAWRREAEAHLLWKHSPLPRFTYPVSVGIIIQPPDARRRDADNLVKPLLDLLVRVGMLADDSLVKSIQVVMDRPSNDPCALVRISEFEQIDLEDAIREASGRLVVA